VDNALDPQVRVWGVWMKGIRLGVVVMLPLRQEVLAQDHILASLNPKHETLNPKP
jgi:hypothetical protein